MTGGDKKLIGIRKRTRSPALCRSWLFVNGADEQALEEAVGSGADVLIQELEDFTPPKLRPGARAISPDVMDAWRAAGAVAAVRVNPLDAGGTDDLAAVMKGAPDIIALPKVSTPAHIEQLETKVARHEADYGIEIGQTLLLPNIETAGGLVRTGDILRSSARIAGCLMASEDLAADLGAERSKDGVELEYARQRFLVECVAAGALAIDCPYTWSDRKGVEKDAIWARRLGYKAKSAVVHSHAEIINRVLTPTGADIDRARRIVAAFEAAQASGRGRVELDGAQIETPIYLNAMRLLERARDLAAAGDEK